MLYIFTPTLYAFSQPLYHVCADFAQHIGIDSSTTVCNSLPKMTKTSEFNSIHLCLQESLEALSPPFRPMLMPSSGIMALGSTQPPTEMSTTDLPGGKRRPERKVDLTAICEPIFYKMWEPRRLTTLWAFTACYRDSYTFSYLCRCRQMPGTISIKTQLLHFRPFKSIIYQPPFHKTL
jgi:hypothetical protein